jgi:hypothetical protein
VSKVQVRAYAECREDGCGWQPDPAARASLDSQAAKHTEATGHPTIAGSRP